MWGAVMGGIGYTISQRGTASIPTWALVFAGFGAFVALLLVGTALQQTIEWARYGDIPAEVSPQPKIGGRLDARVRLPAAAHGESSLQAELACIHVSWHKRQSGKGSNKIEKDLHRESRAFPIAWSGDEGLAEIRFDIPAGLPASDFDREESEDDVADRARGFHYWELKVHVDGWFGGIRRTYPVVVR